MKRTRGQGFVYRPTYIDKRTGVKKTSSTWWIQYFVKAVRFRESSNSRSRNDAEALLRERIEAGAQGKPPPSRVRKVSFDQIEQLLYDDYRSRGRRSLGRMQRAFAHLRSFFSNTETDQIDRELVAAYVRARQTQAAAPGTINRELSALKRALRLAQIAGKMNSRPDFIRLREGNRRSEFFEPHEFESLLQNLPDYLRPVIYTAYVTGWRIGSEILTRKKYHLNLDAGHLQMEPAETKDSIGRTFPLTPRLIEILRQQLIRTTETEKRNGQIIPWLFQRDGRPIKDFRKAWRLACQRTGLEGKVPDDLRRTAVRNLERAGVSRAAAMAMVGHRSESIYRGISAVDASILKESAAKLSTLHRSDTNA